MARQLIDSSALGFFCDSVAVMLAAGIQTDEAVSMLTESVEDEHLRAIGQKVYHGLIGGASLAQAMESAKVFPAYAIDMVAVGERSGKLEDVLRSLGFFYNEEASMFAKVRSAIGYPAALFCIMSVILAFTIAVILPVFVDVYESLAGTLTSGSFAMVGVAVAIGWCALILTLIATVCALVAAIWARTGRGRQRLLRLCAKLPMTRKAIYEMALSRFISVLAAYTASGMNADDAIRETLATVDHKKLHSRVKFAHTMMTDLDNPRSLAAALDEAQIVQAIYGRMLTIGSRTGSLDSVLLRLADMYFHEATDSLDRTVDSIEPVLAAFLTLAVGATLISVMLPLIGIMGSIG